ncbi:MAG: ATP-dependent sacrificial sulfur transferase LarE, partial [Thermoplasmata archaeon]
MNNEQNQDLNKKFDRLKEILNTKERVLVAFSGGTDSSFLLACAKKVLGNNVEAIIVSSQLFPKYELSRAIDFCKKYNINYTIIEKDITKNKKVVSNHPDRCYHCKKAIFATIRKFAQKNGFTHILEGGNADDLNSYRPGKRALQELGIESPLALANLSKDEIRTISRNLGLDTWNLPSAACLASRIPYGEKITIEKLNMVEKSENYLRSLGFSQLRVRHHGNLAKIEILENEWSRLDNSLRASINKELKK